MSDNDTSKHGEAERFVVGENSPVIHYEHAHRYAFAARCTAGLRVLDLASGSGYGSQILRAAGAHVTALDLSVGAARLAEPSACADARQLPFADASFDAVICFEAIEHVPNPDAVVTEIRRVLTRTGWALISTPDREIYTDRMGNRNPFHIAEMTADEFAALLGEEFEHVRLYGQSVWAGSWLAELDSATAETRDLSVVVEDLSGEDRPAAPWTTEGETALPAPMYLIAFCAQSQKRLRELRSLAGRQSVLHDPSQWLLGVYFEALRGLVARDREIETFASHSHDLQLRVASLGQHGTNLEKALDERESILAGVREHVQNIELLAEQHRERIGGLAAHASNLEADLERHRAHAEATESAASERSVQIRGLEKHIANLDSELKRRGAELERHRAHAQHLEEHVEGLLGHSANLETELSGASSHAQNLEAQILQLQGQQLEQIEALGAHAANLEAHSSGVENHAQNLERVVDERSEHAQGLSEHIANLETELARQRGEIDGHRTHAEQLEVHVSGLLEHATNLETYSGGLESHVRNLEAHRRQLEVQAHELNERAAESEESLAEVQLRADRAAAEADQARRDLADIRSSRWFRWLKRIRLSD